MTRRNKREVTSIIIRVRLERKVAVTIVMRRLDLSKWEREDKQWLNSCVRSET